MIRSLLLSSALSLVAASAALAADLPSTKGEPVYAPPPPVFSWTGFYIGVNGGYGGNNVSFDSQEDEGGAILEESNEKLTSSGFVAGGTVGYNYQVPASNFVLGVEGDFDWSNIRGDLSEGESGVDYSYGEGFGSKLNWLATARARIGYAVTTPFGNLLPYITGGGAFGNVNTYSYSYDDGESEGISFGHTWAGWTAGAGLEYAITQNLTFKAEYLYVDLGKHLDDSEHIGGNVYDNIYEHFTANIVRVGLNWKFDWFAPPPPPVVAKY
ncbi:MAG: outer membrane protein [Methylovirgula sp.]